MTSTQPTGPERYRFTQAKLLTMAKERFGDDPKLWKFVCPQCGDVACAQDFLDAKVDPQKIGQECIGRQIGALTKPSPTNTRGCDWCAYGLFQGPWLITLGNMASGSPSRQRARSAHHIGSNDARIMLGSGFLLDDPDDYTPPAVSALGGQRLRLGVVLDGLRLTR